MGILKGLFRTRDAPTNRTAGSAYSFFMGGSTSGKRVNERSAMQMTAVYSCVRILSEAIASLPYECQLESEPRARLILSHLCSFESEPPKHCSSNDPDGRSPHSYLGHRI